MKNLKFTILFLLVLFLVNSAFAQNKFYGTVTEVIDGKSLVIEPKPNVKIKLELQFIEVPESEQKLHSLVKNHLSKMILNKYVEFQPKNINAESSPVGKVLLNGVDVGQQMLRDGAAWYAILEKNNHNEAESKIYRNNETLAKKEQRGVWSIADLKPSWEFRAAKAEAKRQAELKKLKEEKAQWAKKAASKNKRVHTRNNQAQVNARFGVETISTELPYRNTTLPKSAVLRKGEHDLWYMHDVVKDEGWVGTPIMTFNVFNKDDLREVIFGTGYDYKGKKLKRGGNEFTIAIGAKNFKKPFMKSGFSIELNNNKKIILSKKDSRIDEVSKNFSELFAYRITRAELTKLAESDNATIVAGKYRRKMSKKIKDSLLALISVTEK